MREDSCDEMEEMLKEQAKVAYRPEPKREAAAARGRQQPVGSSRTKEKAAEEQLPGAGAAIPGTKVEALQEEEKVVAPSEDARPSSSSAQPSASAATTRPRRRGSGGRLP